MGVGNVDSAKVTADKLCDFVSCAAFCRHAFKVEISATENKRVRVVAESLTAGNEVFNTVLTVGIGEILSVYVCGMLLYFAIAKRNLRFGN